MAQITQITTGAVRHRAGVRRMKKDALRIDMTPMVDLGFLLISFFVITTELTRPGAMPLIMPKDTDKPMNDLGESYALTVLLDGDRSYYYEKNWVQAKQAGNIHEISRKELREVIIRKQKRLDDTTVYKEGRKGLMLLIKPGSQASYESLVDVLDEVAINAVDKYALLQISPEESGWLRQRQ